MKQQKVRYLYVGSYVVACPTTGNRYAFDESNRERVVDSRDVPYLLERRRRHGCCGTPVREEPIFALS